MVSIRFLSKERDVLRTPASPPAAPAEVLRKLRARCTGPVGGCLKVHCGCAAGQSTWLQEQRPWYRPWYRPCNIQQILHAWSGEGRNCTRDAWLLQGIILIVVHGLQAPL